MGPQHVRCGMRQDPTRTATSASAFNGAATCSLRNVSCLEWEKEEYDPSMGPQHVRCGMLTLDPGTHVMYVDLQWGRNMFVAE